MNYITFRVDSPFRFSSILVASEDGNLKEARSYAISVIGSLYGRRSAVRVTQESGKAYGPDPICDEPIKNAVSRGEQCAWLCFDS